MSAISTWSTTAGSNNSSPPNGWPEGMAASKVNDSAREMMAAIRVWYEEPEWISLGVTFTRQDEDTVTTAADQSAIFHQGRRVRVVGSSTGTIYGFVSSVVTTTINFTFDSGSIAAGDATVTVSHAINSADSSSIPLSATAGGLKHASDGLAVDINDTTSESAPASGDAVLIYDITATENRKTTLGEINSQVAACVLLGAQSAAADEYITFAEIFTSTYAMYKIAYYDVICTNDLLVPLFQLGTGSTPTWIAGTNYTGGWHWIDNNSTPQHGFSWAAYTSKTTGRLTAYDTGTDASNREQTSGELILMNPASTIASDRQHVRHESWGQNSNSIPYWNTGMTVVVKTAAITSIRFTVGDGSTQVHTGGTTLGTGEFRVYGYRNA